MSHGHNDNKAAKINPAKIKVEFSGDLSKMYLVTYWIDAVRLAPIIESNKKIKTTAMKFFRVNESLSAFQKESLFSEA